MGGAAVKTDEQVLTEWMLDEINFVIADRTTFTRDQFTLLIRTLLHPDLLSWMADGGLGLVPIPAGTPFDQAIELLTAWEDVQQAVTNQQSGTVRGKYVWRSPVYGQINARFMFPIYDPVQKYREPKNMACFSSIDEIHRHFDCGMR